MLCNNCLPACHNKKTRQKESGFVYKDIVRIIKFN